MNTSEIATKQIYKYPGHFPKKKPGHFRPGFFSENYRLFIYNHLFNDFMFAVK